jgi:16S rRNA (guanine966-N2)-methyltransferase
VTFIDQSAESLSLTRSNTAHIGETEHAHFIRSDSTSLPPARARHTLAFLDPPYRSGLAPKSLVSLDRQGWLEKGAIVVVETEAKEVFETPEHYAPYDDRKYGNTRIVFLQYEGAS